MKKNQYFIWQFAYFALFVFAGLGLSACGDDDDDDLLVPQPQEALKAECTLAIENSTIELGSTLSATVSLDVSRSTSGAQITRVEFYWDNQFLSASIAAPFTFSHNVENASIGAHTLLARVTVSKEGSQDLTLTKEATVTVTQVTEKVPTVGCYAVFPHYLCGSEPFYHAWVYLDPNETSPGCEIKKVDYYFDDRFVRTSTSESAYAFNLQIKNASEYDSYKVKAVVTIGGKGYVDIEKTLEDKVVVSPVNVSYWGVDLLHGSQRLIKNGQSLRINIWKAGMMDDAVITNLYWDDKLVGTGELEVQGNNIVSYKVEGASTGAHKVTLETILRGYNKKTQEYEIIPSNKEDITITVIE